MTPHHLLAALSDQGISLEAHDGNLHFRAPKGIFTPELRLQVAEHKAELLELLYDRTPDHLPDSLSFLPAEWADQYEERAAIREYDGGLSREQAERLAEEDVRQLFHKGKPLLN